MEPVFFKVDDVEHCDHEMALSELLEEGVLFCNTRFYSETKDGKTLGQTLVLFVICNDIFAWACADAEEITCQEIEGLYRMWKADPKWGAAKWCALRRKQLPQVPAIELMQKDGVWDDAMKQLEPKINS